MHFTNNKHLSALLFLPFLMVVFLFFAFWPIENNTQIPKSWPKPFHKLRKIDSNWFKLGRMLFYDTRISKNQMVSCASCHQSATAFAHVDHPLSHGVYDRIGIRNAPALFNLAWYRAFMWDGRAVNAKAQAQIPIEHPDEMDMPIHQAVQYINQAPVYKKAIQQCTSSYSVNASDVLHAIEVFVLNIISSQSKYDLVRAGKAQFNADESAGYTIYKTHCASCHAEPLMSTGDLSSNKLPLQPNRPDYGRYNVTLQAKDSLTFKIPSLRNLSYSFPYMHDGRFSNLRQVLQHYRYGPGKLVYTAQPFTLENENQLLAFLFSLNDSVFVQNPVYKVPQEIRMQ